MPTPTTKRAKFRTPWCFGWDRRCSLRACAASSSTCLRRSRSVVSTRARRSRLRRARRRAAMPAATAETTRSRKRSSVAARHAMRFTSVERVFEPVIPTSSSRRKAGGPSCTCCTRPGARPNLGPGRRYRFLSACSATVRSAVGTASSRSSGIGSPLSIERPYVPASSLASARSSAASWSARSCGEARVELVLVEVLRPVLGGVSRRVRRLPQAGEGTLDSLPLASEQEACTFRVHPRHSTPLPPQTQPRYRRDDLDRRPGPARAARAAHSIYSPRG